jgi:hypothetical protein
VSPSASGWTTVPAALYYQAAGAHYALRRLADYRSVRTTYMPPGTVCGLYLSPDGRRVAWVAVDGGGATGDLIVAGSDGQGRRTLLTNVVCTAENVPVWMPDSIGLLIQQDYQAPRRLVDVDTGEVHASPLAATQGDIAWSPNGEFVAYQDNGRIVVARPDGTIVHRVAHGDETPTGGFTVQGVADDGRRVVVGMRPSDPGQVRTGFRLVDVVTGKNLTVPHATANDAAIYPGPGNTLLVRSGAKDGHHLYLIGADGAVLDQRAEPPSLGEATLLLTPGVG